MRIIDCGLMAYREALALQERLVAGIAAGGEDEVLLLLEHPPVYTIGRGGTLAHVLDPAIRVERINRGGEVTWHGPGQVVGYPLINLGQRGRDLHRWLRFLEEWVMGCLTAFDISGHCRAGSAGVWTAGGKIASIGIGVRRWVTMHGFGLNVHPDLRAFDRINPCGIAGCPMTSMAQELGFPPSRPAVNQQLQKDFASLLEERLPISSRPPDASWQAPDQKPQPSAPTGMDI
jgi:lipoyl(octanoyl) transferase